MKMKHVAKIFSGALLVIVFVVITLTALTVGYVKGYVIGWNAATSSYQKILSNKVSATNKPVSTSVPASSKLPATNSKPSWGGPQLWEAVNKRRIQLGVNPLSVKDELCTIASIRLNQLLALGTLDGHVGFSKMSTDRPDLKWIFEKYNLSEFLVSGATTPEEAVSMWENTLGHKELLSGGQYVWGCIYAQNGIGVAIAAY